MANLQAIPMKVLQADPTEHSAADGMPRDATYRDSDPAGHDSDPGYRDIYYINCDGSISWGSTKKGQDELLFEVSLHPKRNPTLDKEKYRDASSLAASSARLTLLCLDTFFKVRPLEEKASEAGVSDCLPFDRRDIMDRGYEAIPQRYNNELYHFCEYCELKGEILWRNIRVAESRYESRFRTCKAAAGVCFLQFHTMQVPYLATCDPNPKNVILALVNHIHIPQHRSQTKLPRIENQDEKVFAFVLGLKPDEIDQLWTILKHYQENVAMGANVGITAKLFIAAFLKYYGFDCAKGSIQQGFKSLVGIDHMLLDAEDSLSKQYPITGKEQQQQLDIQVNTCNLLNKQLMELNKTLTGVRSRVHYIGLSARGLIANESSMEAYVREECSRGVFFKIEKAASFPPPHRSQGSDQVATQALRREVTDPLPAIPNDPRIPGDFSQEINTPPPSSSPILNQVLEILDSTRFTRRDNDKLDMISRSMLQYEVDIKSLKAHATIAVGLVANLYAHSQGNFQGAALDHTERDSSNIKLMSYFTALLLPATFWAILITAPMIQWVPPPSPGSAAAYNPWDQSTPTIIAIPFLIWLGLATGSTVSLMLYIFFRDKNYGELKDSKENPRGKQNNRKHSGKTLTFRIASHNC